MEQENGISLEKRGFVNGTLGVVIEHFKNFIEQYHLERMLREQTREAQQKIASLEHELQQLATQKVLLLQDLSTWKGKHEKSALEHERIAKRYNEVKSEIEAQEQASKTISPPYKWLQAVLMLSVGLLLVGAEIVTTANVVSNVFMLEGWEGWLFGAGVALTSFIFKVTYERIFEKPYQEENQKKLMYWLLSGISLLVVGCLTLIGMLRINGISLMKMDVVDENFIESLLSNNILLFASLMVAWLFGLVGAICLTIGFRTAEQLFSKTRLRLLAQKRRDYELSRLHLKLLEAEQEVTNAATEVKTKQIALEQLPDESAIKAQIEEWRKIAQSDELTPAHKQEYQAKTAKDVALYYDAYARGEVFKEAHQTARQEMMDKIAGRNNNAKPKLFNQPYTSGAYRTDDMSSLATQKKFQGSLHEVLRQMISERVTEPTLPPISNN